MGRLSQSGSDAELVDRIFRKEVSKALRNASLLYLVNTVAAYFLVGTLLLFFPSSLPGQTESFSEVYVTAIGVYAIVVYVLYRSRQGPGLRIQSYLLGILGLTGGGLFFVLGSVGFLSIGYWLGQFQGSGGMKCTRDGGEVVAFGQENLACTKCSKLVRIGLDLPRRWTYAGVGLIIAGIAIYFSSVVPAVAGLVYAYLNIPALLVFDGAILALEPLYFQRMFFGGGYVRLPPEQSSPQPA